MVHIRKALQTDQEAVWEIIEKVIAKGDTYAFHPNTPKENMLQFWFGADKHTFVALQDEKIVGTFFIKSNQPGLGAHIANAGYMVAPDSFGMGIGKMMGEYSLIEAKKLGYLAMQFNIVIKTNERAVKLWQKLGFEIIGEIPKAFNHLEKGLVNAYIMYREL